MVPEIQSKDAKEKWNLKSLMKKAKLGHSEHSKHLPLISIFLLQTSVQFCILAIEREENFLYIL